MKLAKAMSMALACAMAATMCATSAFAATSGSTKVNATVTLTNNKGGSGTYTGTIPVNVKGDIGEGQSVTVTSTAPIMKCSGSKNVTASFNGTPKKSWSRMETSGQGTTDNYGLSAVLTPGVWEGTATFSCALA